MPKVSIVMPAYNAEKYIGECIESILNQTFTDFEFIIINDGSNDSTERIILSYQDERIVYVKNDENLKLPKTLNKGIAQAKGKYIARIDSDDVAIHDRLEEQIHFMETNPTISLCGTWIQTFGVKEEYWRHPVSYPHIKVQMLFECCIVHPTAFFRKQDFIDNNLWYDENYLYAEDYELWSRAVQTLKFANIGTALLKYRLHQGQSANTVRDKLITQLVNQIKANQLKNLGVIFTEADLKLHHRLAIGDYELSLSFWEEANRWLSKLTLANSSSKIYDSIALKEVLFKRIWYPCFLFFIPQYQFNKSFWKQIFLHTAFFKPLINTFYQRLLNKFFK